MLTARFIRQFVIFAFTAVVSSAAVQAAEPRKPFDHATLARQALEKHIVPGYKNLVNAAKGLSQEMDRYCAKPPSPKPPRSVDRAFDAFVTAWGRVEHINFGPITQENRLERILFFPDRRGLGARQVARALQKRDPGVTDAQVLASKSVALQGIGALEIVLFGERGKADDNAEARTHRCGFARAVAANLLRLSQEVLDGWTREDGFRHTWLNPGAGNPLFVKPSEVTQVLAKSVDQGLERIRDERVAGPLAFGKQRRRLPAVLEKSNHTFRLTTANLEGLRDLYTTGGIQKAIVATESVDGIASVPDNAALVLNEINTALKIARRLIGVPRPFDNSDITRRLIAMGFPLKNARTQLTILMAATAGLTLGFNSSDGD